MDAKDEGWELVTCACPWGIGGVLCQRGAPKRWFSSPLTPELLDKFSAKKGDPAFNTAWELTALATVVPEDADGPHSAHSGCCSKLTSQLGALAVWRSSPVKWHWTSPEGTTASAS